MVFLLTLKNKAICQLIAFLSSEALSPVRVTVRLFHTTLTLCLQCEDSSKATRRCIYSSFN